MRNPNHRLRFARLAAALSLSYGMLFQAGGCTLNQITATTVLDGQQAIIQVLRGLILSPIDAYIQQAVFSVFPAEEN